MGSCCESNNSNRIPLKLIPGSELRKVDKNLIQVFPSICKISAEDWTGSGFFIRLKRINFLMTNEHVVPRRIINAKKNILVTYNFEKEKLFINLNKSKRHIQDFRNIGLDITIIEILRRDKVDSNLFLSPEKRKRPSILKNKNIYSPQYPLGKDLSYSYGKITAINKYDLSLSTSVLKGSSGSPIFLENSTKVVGIIKAEDRNQNINYGDLIYPVINEIYSDDDEEQLDIQ